jgi:hypothetical protein
MDSSVSPKDDIWFLRVCHHISNAVYIFLTIYIATEKNYYIRTKHDCTSPQYIFDRNISVIGHKQRRVGFLQRKPPSRSTANSTVTTFTFRHLNSISCGYKAEAEKRWNNASELEGRRTKIVQGYVNRRHSCHPTPIRVPLRPWNFLNKNTEYHRCQYRQW